ncbi:MAG: adenylyl-sulfate reductase subunit alpha [Deltaproteobacteria bacterium]|nr:adenylyl-sulfate reductase subunit alpha [Deltaproteobacteria bacterium]
MLTLTMTIPLETRTHRFGAAVVGGGAAGCLAAIRLAERGIGVALVEKAHIERSGCLAAGVNALNAYVGRGHGPEDYADYALSDAHGIARADLLLSMARRLNRQARWLEGLGLSVHRDREGRPAERGWRNLMVNGENLKPLLAAAARAAPGVTIFERAAATHLLAGDGSVAGLVALAAGQGALVIEAPAVLVATGGAAGIYRPANAGRARGQSWYPPFNTGAGLAMGIRAGAEMTTLEMRFVALRCRETMAPTGTLALGAGARQVNGLGEPYEARYGRSTSQRVLAARRETQEGRGPCFLLAEAGREARAEIYRAYLNMCPSQTLRLLEEDLAGHGTGDGAMRVEIGPSEPFVQGGHTAGGYWVDTGRRTTIVGLWAAGDVSGGAPQKYATGALAEAEMAAETMAEAILGGGLPPRGAGVQARAALDELSASLAPEAGPIGPADIEEALQRTMDLYAGGLGSGFRYGLRELSEAEARLGALEDLAGGTRVSGPRDLARLWEARERLVVARSLVAHLKARRETRWPGFGEFSDFPGLDPSQESYVNSVARDGRIEIIRRPLVKGETYGHGDAAWA